MYGAVALLLLVSFFILPVVLPVRFAGWSERVILRLRKLALGGPPQTVFDEGQVESRQLLRAARVWGGVSAGFLGLFILIHGDVIRDELSSIGTATTCGISAFAASAFCVLSWLAYTSFLRRARGYETLRQYGIRALWVADPKNPNKSLLDALAQRLRDSNRVGILDVTGYELLGKGPGPAGGLLHDALETVSNVPVHLLLFKPDAHSLDPEGKRATITQSVLADMRTTSATYGRRLQTTMNAIELLNQGRAPEAQIEVRFYCEKPAMRLILFDESILLSPWCPGDNGSPLPFLEAGAGEEGPFFFEAFRRPFNRLWASAVPLKPTQPKGPALRLVKNETARQPVAVAR